MFQVGWMKCRTSLEPEVAIKKPRQMRLSTVCYAVYLVTNDFISYYGRCEDVVPERHIGGDQGIRLKKIQPHHG